MDKEDETDKYFYTKYADIYECEERKRHHKRYLQNQELGEIYLYNTVIKFLYKNLNLFFIGSEKE